MRALAHPGRHESRKLHVLPLGTAFVMILSALITLFVLLLVAVEAR
jgi:hypothetical protein